MNMWTKKRGSYAKWQKLKTLIIIISKIGRKKKMSLLTE